MKKRIIFSGLCAGIWCVTACSRPTVPGNYRVIPLPQEIVMNEEEPFVLDEQVKIFYPANNPKMKANADFLAAIIKEHTGGEPTVTENNGKINQGIIVELDSSVSHPEGYKLTTDRRHIRIAGRSEAGVFYGIQTLRKAIPTVGGDTCVILPAGEVTDYPRFAYRGALLDVGRHYFPVSYVKKFIDMLALHNINTFHWHLTEDQGWRIEIRKYPKLTEIGSRRKETIRNWETKEMDGQPYGGFYSQAQIKEIVAYASERYITVIPEIDLPGHMLAALASYPELGCTGGPYEVATTFGVFADVLCAGKEKSLEFVKDVLEEVMELFPSSYIHIGGDECPKARWKKCPACQAAIRKNGIKAKPGHTPENQLQTWFMAQVEEFINSKGRRMIGWDEILEGGLTPDATVMSWRGVQGGVKAAQQHHNVIMTPYNYLYFSNPHILKLQGLETVKRVYNFEPLPEAIEVADQPYVIGAQASIWTEWIKDSSRLEYVVLPRLAAASEIFWLLPEKKKFEDFAGRLPRMLDIYGQKGYAYRKDIYHPYIRTKKVSADSAEVMCETFDQVPVRYTLDGSTPDTLSRLYAAPFRVGKGTVIKAVAVRDNGLSDVQTLKY